MNRETGFMLGVFIVAFASGTAAIVHFRSTSLQPGGITQVRGLSANTESHSSKQANIALDQANEKKVLALENQRKPDEFKSHQELGKPLVLSATNPFTTIEGCFILAEDGQYLGKITWSEFDSESILNKFGKYGSKFSGTSIFNDFGKYGGEFAHYSPFNSFTDSPPKIYTRNGDFVAYLSANKLKSGPTVGS